MAGGLSRALPGAIIGAAVLTGWFLLDLFVLLVSGEPALVLDILPPTLAVIAAGGVLGSVLARRPRLALVGVPALVIASKLPAFTPVHLQETEVWLIRMSALAWLAIAATSVLRRRPGFDLLRAALSLGCLCALFQTTLRIDPHPLAWAAALACGGCLLVGFLPGPALRRGLTVLLLAVPGFLVAKQLVAPRVPMRPDLPPPSSTAQAGAPNLVMIIVDTLRADHLASYGYERVTTPGLDAFARDHATRYTQARSTSPYTLSTHASLFTGLHSVEHGSTHPRPHERPIREEVPTLAERLREIGYRTCFVVANGTYLCEEFGLDRGFEHFHNLLGGRSHPGRGFYLMLGQLTGVRLEVSHTGHLNAERITNLAIDWIDEHGDTPFFLAVNYFDVHHPYFPIPPYDKAFSDEQPREPLRPDMGIVPLVYDRELLYTDAHITRLLDQLESRESFENTVVIVTSDHGEALGERGYPEHCWTMYENVVHVPLLVKPVGARATAVEHRRVSSAEVHDIALRELGLLETGRSTSSVDVDLIGEWYGSTLSEYLPYWADGVDAELLTDVMAFFEGTRKVIVRSDGTVEAFDLEHDPCELEPLSLTDAERAAAVDRARQWWRDHPPDPFEEIELDEDVLESMRALGYAGDR